MTVALAVVTSDGIVIAADSRTTWGVTDQNRVLSDFTHKVFRVADFGVTTYGWAFLLERNIAGHIGEFARSRPEGSSLQEVAEQLAQYMGDRIDEHVTQGNDPAPDPGVDPLGFLVAGYDNGEARMIEVLLPSREVNDISVPGAAWRGQTDVIARLVKGVDLGCLVAVAGDAGKLAELEALLPEIPKLEYVIPFHVMNLQDGIDVAVLLIRTTIDVQRLTYGTFGALGSWPGVGAPIEIGVIRAEDGFSWVQRTVLQGERPAGEAEGGPGAGTLR